jgi:hypothetical protein
MTTEKKTGRAALNGDGRNKHLRGAKRAANKASRREAAWSWDDCSCDQYGARCTLHDEHNHENQGGI